MYHRTLTRILALLVLVACGADSTQNPLAPSAPEFLKGTYDAWSLATSIESAPPGAHPSFNTAALEGCPFEARDGKTFFLASNRAGGLGGIDIYVSTRESVDDPWGAPVNVGSPVNSASNEFCPTLARDGHTFYFVSDRPGGCGGDDIYKSRWHRRASFDTPVNLGCQVNSAGNEASPFPLPEPGSGEVLYYSSTRSGGFSAEAPGAVTGDADLYRSERQGGRFGPGKLVPGVNSAFNDGQPNVRRDAQEIFFFSNRPGTLGMNDIYSASRTKARSDWSTPVNLGPNVNSPLGESRPSLSWDGTRLYFGSTRAGGEGASDIYVTTRQQARGHD